MLTFEYSCSAAVLSFFATASWSATSDCSEMRRSPFTWVSFSLTQLSFTTSLVARASSSRPSTSLSTERMRLTAAVGTADLLRVRDVGRPLQGRTVGRLRGRLCAHEPGP